MQVFPWAWPGAFARVIVAAIAVVVGAACGQLDRDNPTDPDVAAPGVDEGIELRAAFPGDDSALERAREVRFRVVQPAAAGDVEVASGTMNMVGRVATARIPRIAPALGLAFSADAYDAAGVRTFAASDTVDISDGTTGSVQLRMERLTGALELTARLPPEIDSVQVVVFDRSDSLVLSFSAAAAAVARIPSLPTGSAVLVGLRAIDADGQVLIQQQSAVDIRDDLVARLSLAVIAGAVRVSAIFPDYLLVQDIDRFSDAAGTFFRRSIQPQLPAPGKPVDFDTPAFLYRGRGPDGEAIQFYHFDVKSDVPAPVYVPVDSRGAAINGQLPIFGLIPGDEGYNDLHQIHTVRIADFSYRPNRLTSVQDVLESGYEITATADIMNCVMVPEGSTARLRLDASVPRESQDGWYQGRIVKFLLFESPAVATPVVFSGERLDAAQMYAFLQNDRDFSDGFARDADGFTHNVITRLPGTEADYSPLWVLRVLRLSVFDRVTNAASAATQVAESFHQEINDQQILINAPIVWTP